MRVLFVAIFAFAMLATAAKAQQWSDSDLGRVVVEGAADARHLWLRGEHGVLVRFDRQTGERTVLGRGFADLLPDGGRLWTVSKAEGAREIIISDLRAPERPPIRFYPDGEPIGLFTSGSDRPGLLTTSHVLRPEPGRWRRWPLAAELQPYAHVAVGADGRLYVGYNRGEWGGGLRRVDPDVGSIVFVSETSDELCGGQINPDCAPIVGVFPDPEQPACMIAGTSLAHMSSRRGQVLRICGDRITPVFADPLPPTPGGLNLPNQTWPFDSLVPTHDGWIAVSQDRYARSLSGSVEMQPTPPLKDWSGLRISDERDGVLFVLAACCWGSGNPLTSHRLLAIPVEPAD